MEILFWLAPPAAVTVLAMIWAAWAGRPRREAPARREEAAYFKFSKAIVEGRAAAAKPRVAAARDRSTGIAVRPSRRG